MPIVNVEPKFRILIDENSLDFLDMLYCMQVKCRRWPIKYDVNGKRKREDFESDVEFVK